MFNRYNDLQRAPLPKVFMKELVVFQSRTKLPFVTNQISLYSFSLNEMSRIMFAD